MKWYVKNIVAVVALLLVALLVSGWTGWSCFAQRYEKTTIYYTVQSGDTLWEIGERHYSAEDRRKFNEFMYDFRASNGFAPGSGRKYLQPGEILTITLEQRVR